MNIEICHCIQVLNSLSIMIERINRKVRDEADLLLKCLPELWTLSEAHNLLRGAVINVLTNLVKVRSLKSSLLFLLRCSYGRFYDACCFTSQVT